MLLGSSRRTKVEPLSCLVSVAALTSRGDARTQIMTSQPNTLLPLGSGPKVVVYHQTHYGPDNGPPVSLLPLITNNTGVTHVIVAAIHLNEGPGNITINDDHPEHEKYGLLYGEMAWLQASGAKVLAMLGGAAKGSYERLDGADSERFEAYYIPLRDMLRKHNFDGLDLDIEEPMSLTGVIRLIDRLRADFGQIGRAHV